MMTWKASAVSFTALLLSTRACSDPLVDGIVDWICSEGGFFSEKVEIRRVDPSDTSSYFGVFAKEDIEPQERLFDIPHSCFIALWDEAMKPEMAHDANAYYGNLCLLAKKLMKEMKLGKDSKFAPYVAFLQTQKRGQLPATWSQAGKNVLRKMLDPGADGVDFIDMYFKDTGCIDKNDLSQEHAVAMVLQRGYDTALVPVWDMVNHHNGLLNTDHNSVHDGGKDGMLNVKASKVIQKGDEVFASYDTCVDCADQSDFWGTPELLRDFGFVEPYPQRWILNNENIYFEVYNTTEDGFYVWWDVDSPDELPNSAEVQFLEEQLAHLEEMNKGELRERGSVPQNEWDIILQFHQAKTVAIAAALDSLKEQDQEL